MADKKIYVGAGKKKSDTWLKVTINPEKLKEHIQKYQGKPFVKLDINIYDEPDKFGKDVKVTIDTWEPEGSQSPKGEPVKDCPQPEADDESSDDLPF